MIFYVAAVAALALWGVRVELKGFHADYIEKEQIQPIKGIFILLILLSHFSKYAALDTLIDRLGTYLFSKIGQCVVAAFLFYSGYGVTRKILRDGEAYLSTFLQKRVLKVYVQFVLAVLLYLALGLLLGNSFSVPQVLLSLVGWESLGNENWYIFCILLLYLFTWAAFSLCKNQDRALLMVTALTLAYIVAVWHLRHQYFWINSALCYVAGMYYARYQREIEGWVMANNRQYFLALLAAAGLFVLTRLFFKRSVYLWNLITVSFALTGVLLTMKVKVRSRFLAYCGTHLFSLFMLHHLPMIALQETLLAANQYVYFLTSVLITFALSYLFDLTVPRLWAPIQRRLLGGGAA